MSANLKFSSVSPVRAAASSAMNSGFLAHHGIWAPGVRLFRKLGFTAKALIISLAFMLPMLSLLSWQLNAQSSDAMQARMTATRQHVEVAYGGLVWAQAQEAAGSLTRAQAQQLAKQLVSKMRYDGSNYFWINDMEPRIVMHPIKPDLDDRNVADMKDPTGFALFQGFADEVRKHGKGYVAYQWPKPGSEKPVDKISYVQGFEPWGWVIGSGVYIGDLQQAARRELLWTCGVVALALLIAGYLFLSFYRVMDGGLKETRRHLDAIAAGDLSTTPAPWGSDEAAQLMLVLRHMQESLRGMVQRVRRSSDEIVQSSSEISHGAMDLSSRTSRRRPISKKRQLPWSKFQRQ
ncbi:cache domain-containing protein [Roseateles sp. GG27B]